jgi:16S rRNA processing protein RimM
MADDVLRVGRVSRAHGLTGEVEVRLDWAESRGLREASRVVLEAEDGRRREHDIVRVRQSPKGVLLQLSGIADRDAAEAITGQVVSIPRDALPTLAEGEYYLCDLVGVRVSCPEGPIGTVVEVQVYPSVDAVVIEDEAGERFEQPLLDEWIAEVDVPARSLVLTSRAGLIEMPRPSRSEKAAAGKSEG